MIVDRDGHTLDLAAMAGLVAAEVFGAQSARFLEATPFGGAAGASFRLVYEVDGQRRLLFIKLPAERGARHALIGARLREEYRLSDLVQRHFPATAQLQTVTPAGFVEALQGFASWAVAGDSLEAQLRRRCLPWAGDFGAATAWCRQAGEWLSLFHRLPSPYEPADLRSLLDTYYDDRLVTLAQLPHSGVSQTLAATLKSSLMTLVDSALARTPVVLCHNDYSPHNMLVDGNRLCVLDYSFAGPGLPVFDVACFWHKLADLKDSALLSNRRVARLQQAFLDGSGAGFDPSTPAVRLGLARLVLSKMITVLKDPAQRVDRRHAQRRRYRAWLAWLVAL